MIGKIFAAGLLALLATRPALAGTWYVNVDTGTLAGQTGWLDFQFNAADSNAPAATATLTAFNSNGSILPGATSTGDVTGSLGSTLVLGNSQFLNDQLQGFTFGSMLSFSVNINVPAPNASGSGTAFSLSLYDSSYNSLLADPVWGAALVINANDNGTMDVLASSSAVSLSTTTPTPVPLPGASGLLLAGISILAGMGRTRFQYA